MSAYLFLTQFDIVFGVPSRRLANLSYVLWTVAFNVTVLAAFMAADVAVVHVQLATEEREGASGKKKKAGKICSGRSEDTTTTAQQPEENAKSIRLLYRCIAKASTCVKKSSLVDRASPSGLLCSFPPRPVLLPGVKLDDGCRKPGTGHKVCTCGPGTGLGLRVRRCGAGGSQVVVR